MPETDDDTQLHKAKMHAGAVLPPALAAVAVRELQTAIDSRTLLDKDFLLAAEILGMQKAETITSTDDGMQGERGQQVRRAGLPGERDHDVRPHEDVRGARPDSAATGGRTGPLTDGVPAKHYTEFDALLRQAAQVARDHGDTLHANEFDNAMRTHSLKGCYGLDACFYPAFARNYMASRGPAVEP